MRPTTGFKPLLISINSPAEFSSIKRERCRLKRLILMVSSFEIPKDAEFETLRTNGIKVNYWVVCKRKVWLYAKGLKRKTTF